MRNVESREYSSSQPADRRALAEIDDLIDNGAYEAAGVMAWDVQRAAPGDPEVWLQLTRIDYLRERYAGAMYAARMATRLDPSSTDAWLWLARAGATRSRWRTEALDAALQATALGSEDPRTWTVLAELHLARDARYEAAIAAERAVRVGPTDVAAHRTLGEIAVRAGEWAHAVAAFRSALELDPEDARARAGLVESLRAQGVDPAEELARFGGGVPGGRGVGGRMRAFAKRNLDLSDPGPLTARRGGLLLGVAACVVAGVVVGVLAPGLGAVRGLAGATALALMWIALWPLQRRPVRPATPAVAPAGGVITSTRPGRSDAPSDDSVLLSDRRSGRGRRRDTAKREGRDSAGRGARETPEPASEASRSQRAPQEAAPRRAPRMPAARDGDAAAGRADDTVAARHGDGARDAEPAPDQAAASTARGSLGRARAMRARADRDRLGRMTRPGGLDSADDDRDAAPAPGDAATSHDAATSRDGDGVGDRDGVDGPAATRGRAGAAPGDVRRAGEAAPGRGGEAAPGRGGDGALSRRGAGDGTPRRGADDAPGPDGGDVPRRSDGSATRRAARTPAGGDDAVPERDTATDGGRARTSGSTDRAAPADRAARADAAPAAATAAPDAATAAPDAAAAPAAAVDAVPDAAGAGAARAKGDATPTAGGRPASPTDDASAGDVPPDDLPSDPEELFRLSAAKLAEFDLDAARAAAQRLAEVDPGSIATHRALGAVSLAAQEYRQAEEHYGRVLDIEPLDQEAHERLAMARKGRHREQPPRHRRRKG